MSLCDDRRLTNSSSPLKLTGPACGVKVTGVSCGDGCSGVELTGRIQLSEQCGLTSFQLRQTSRENPTVARRCRASQVRDGGDVRDVAARGAATPVIPRRQRAPAVGFGPISQLYRGRIPSRRWILDLLAGEKPRPRRFPTAWIGSADGPPPTVRKLWTYPSSEEKRSCKSERRLASRFVSSVAPSRLAPSPDGPLMALIQRPCRRQSRPNESSFPRPPPFRCGLVMFAMENQKWGEFETRHSSNRCLDFWCSRVRNLFLPARTQRGIDTSSYCVFINMKPDVNLVLTWRCNSCLFGRRSSTPVDPLVDGTIVTAF